MSSLFIPAEKKIFFQLKAIGDLETILSYASFSDYSADLIQSVLSAASEFARDVLAPLNLMGHLTEAHYDNGVVTQPAGFKEAYQMFVQNGWNTLPFPVDKGGQGLPWLVAFAIQELWQSANMSFALCPVLNQGAIELMVSHASKDLQAKFLPKLMTGEWTGTMNLTEPQAGSDVGAVKTQAVKEGDHYRIKGQKIFISYGEHSLTENIIHMVLARTPNAAPGTKGLSLFLVPKFLVNEAGQCTTRNEIHCMAIEKKMGLHCSPTAVLSYGDDKGAIGYLMGEEGQGISLMFVMMNNARISVGLQGIGIAERAYQQALDYAKMRIQGKSAKDPKGPSVPIIDHIDVRRMLAEMKTMIDASRGILYLAGHYMDKSFHAPDEAERQKADAYVQFLTPIVKVVGTETGSRVSDLGIQIHGGMGVIQETGAAQYLLDVRVTEIYEGTSGIQAADFAFRKTARDKGAVAYSFIDDMSHFAHQLKAEPQLSGVSQRFERGIAILKKAVGHVCSSAAENVDIASAMAMPYLKLWGVSLGSYIHLKQALAAKDDSNNMFQAETLSFAAYYGDRFLSEADTYFIQMEEASKSLANIPVDFF